MATSKVSLSSVIRLSLSNGRVVPDMFVGSKIKDRAFDPAVVMLREVYEQHGWSSL